MAALTLTTSTATLLIVSACVTIPAYGAWSALLEIDATDPADLVGLASLALPPDDDGAARLFRGFLYNASIRNGRAHARLFPGSGGLILPLPPKGYKDTPARLVVADILSEAGDLLDATSEGLSEHLRIWTRRAGVAAQLLSDLCSALSLAWYANDDGTIRIGDRPARDYPGAFFILSEDREHQNRTLDLAGVDLTPGDLIEDQPVDRVVYYFEANGRRTEIGIAA